jgi:hypothetical protein
MLFVSEPKVIEQSDIIGFGPDPNRTCLLKRFILPVNGFLAIT